MNWVLMLVLLVLVCCAIYGYTKGFLRIVFSLVAWVIVLVFVSWATPHVSQWIQENTTIYEKIEAACEESVRRAAQGKMEEGAAEQYGGAGELGLPESVMAQIVSGASGAADTVLAETGVYAGIAQSLAGFIVQGIAFVTVLILSWILVHVISALLGIVSHIPILKGVNRFTGMLAGLMEGLLIVWIAFYIVALCSTGETGRVIVSYINQSAFLKELYENNILLSLGTGFVRKRA